MRVAVDMRMWRHSGAGRYLRELHRRLPGLLPDVDWTWIANPDCRPAPPPGSRVRVDVLPRPVPVYHPVEQWVMARRLAATGADLVHWPHFNVPLLSGIPRIVTIYDLIYLLFPESCPGLAARLYARFMYRRATAGSRPVLTISETVRKDLEGHLGVPRERIVVTPCGAPGDGPDMAGELVADHLAALGLERKRYWLYVGIHIPHKNLSRLVEAFAALGPEARDMRLVVAGRKDPRWSALYRRAEALAPGRVLFTDHVAEERLEALYRGALAFVTPSLYEGFGLPPLEALARGTPVLAARSGSMPEILGDGALWFDPLSVDEIAGALQRSLSGDGAMEASLGAGRERLGRYDWDDCARKTAAVFAAELGIAL